MSNKKINNLLSYKLSKLESFSPHIIEATLRGMSLDEIFRDFYRVNSPRFQGFRQLCYEISQNISSKSFDIQMTIVHNDFLTALMNIITNQLNNIGIDEDSFVRACLANNSSLDSVPMKLINFLDSQANFITFGENMEDKFHQYFNTKVESKEKKHVRVLWDIENIGISAKSGGALETITKLQNFLESKSLFGTGIDCRITAFFAPNNSSIPQKVIEELDKAAVELVWVSGKREDADRKLGNRITQETQVLAPNCTSFVVITSDQDFRHHFQSLRNSGFSVIVIHNALSSNWMNVMELHSTEAYHWNDIMTSPISVVDQKRTFHKKHSKSRKKEQSINNENQNIQDDKIIETTNPETDTINLNLDPIEGNDKIETPTDWIQGICTRWKVAYGFCRVTSTSMEYLNKDVFVHHSILPKECKGIISRGQLVHMKIMNKKKGLQAIEIMLINLPSHPLTLESKDQEGVEKGVEEDKIENKEKE